MRWALKNGSRKATVSEVGTINWDRPGGLASEANAEVMDRVSSQEIYMEIITAMVRVTGEATMATDTEYRTVVTVETGVRVGVKGTNPTLSISKMVKGSSTSNRPTTT